MKRLLFTLTTTLLVSLCLAGCNTNSSESTTSTEPTTVEPVQTFTVNFYDFEDNKIYETQVQSGGTATFVGDLPSIPATLEKIYPFTGWDTSLENVTCNLDVKPTHGEEYNIYDFEFVSDCKVFQNAAEFNEDTTDYIGFIKQFGFVTYLQEGVSVDGSWKTTDIIDYDDETVEFDYSGVDVTKKGDYTLKVTVRGLTKEFPIKVVTNTDEWVLDKKVDVVYDNYDPDFSHLEAVYLYEDNKCLLDSSIHDKFDAYSYELADENTTIIIRSEDGISDCKYSYAEKIGAYKIGTNPCYINGSFYDFIKIFTVDDFTTTTTGYAYIEAKLYSAVFGVSPKYEYNPDTKEMKIYTPFLYGHVHYDPDSGSLVYTE